MRAIKNILQEDYKLGILRYAENFDKYYKDTLDEKGLRCELITEFHYVLIMSANSPLAKKEDLSFVDLSDYIEIAHADPYVPSLPLSEERRASRSGQTHFRVRTCKSVRAAFIKYEYVHVGLTGSGEVAETLRTRQPHLLRQQKNL